MVATPGRGTTRIADRAVARIAARAARDALVPHTRPGHHPHAPRARITTGSGAVRVALQVRLPYPADLAAICTRLQDDVALRLGELTGLQVREITVDIEQCNVESTTATPTRRWTSPSHHPIPGPVVQLWWAAMVRRRPTRPDSHTAGGRHAGSPPH
ncbi:Asp23/Gls24 family envelope stress response protein [Streptacidiphilus sp. PAMC 29251]